MVVNQDMDRSYTERNGTSEENQLTSISFSANFYQLRKSACNSYRNAFFKWWTAAFVKYLFTRNVPRTCYCGPSVAVSRRIITFYECQHEIWPTVADINRPCWKVWGLELWLPGPILILVSGVMCSLVCNSERKEMFRCLICILWNTW